MLPKESFINYCLFRKAEHSEAFETFLQKYFHWIGDINTDYEFKNCFIFNFGSENNLSLNQMSFSVTESKNLTKEFRNILTGVSTRCFVVIVHGKYLSSLNSILEKVKMISTSIGIQPKLVAVLTKFKNNQIIIDRSPWPLVTFN